MQILPLLFVFVCFTHVMLSKLLNLSVAQFSHLRSGESDSARPALRPHWAGVEIKLRRVLQAVSAGFDAPLLILRASRRGGVVETLGPLEETESQGA